MNKRWVAVRPLWHIYESIAMVMGQLALALICLTWLPFALLLKPLLPARLAPRWGRAVIMAGFRLHLAFLQLFCACRFDLSELDQLRHAGPLIVAANHPSRLDVMLIISRLPNVVCVMKAALMDNILFGAAARLARYIRNDAALTMILDARDELQAGAQLLIFPEGSRTGNFPFDVCTPSTALIASRTGIPVQTVLIEFSSPYLGKAWPLFKRPQLPLHCRIRLGRRFPAACNIAALTAELDAYFGAELGQKNPSTAAAIRA